MNTYVDDTNAVSESDATIFTMISAGPVAASITLVNTGSNTLNYHFQELVPVSGEAPVWTDMASSGSILNNSLAQGAVSAPITISSNWSQVRLNANASGGSTLNFSVTRYFNRADGANLPLISD